MKSVWAAALAMGVLASAGQSVGSHLGDIIGSGRKFQVSLAEDSRTHSTPKLERASVKSQISRAEHSGWLESFDVSKADLLPEGDNPFIKMQPGRVLRLKHGNDTLTLSVLGDQQDIDGVRTGVLEERETKGGKLIEVSRNFLATHKTTGDIYYFGEDVDNYKGGRIISHDSAWRAGVQGARFGLMIPAVPTVGEKFYQEVAPKVAMDRVEIVSLNETVKTPAGIFQRVVHLRETTPLELGVSHKYYAPGIGLIKDDDFELAELPSSGR
jgi:hypothetical protein